MANRQCKVCCKELDESMFRGKPSSRREYKATCKLCEYAKIKERHSANPTVRKEIVDRYRAKSSDRLRDWRKEYKAKNAEKLRLQSAEYAKQNRDALRLKTAAHYAENKDRILANKKAYYEAHPERLSEKGSKYYLRNKNAVLNRGRAYRAVRPEVSRAAVTRRRARIAKAIPAWYGELDSLVEIEASSLCILREAQTGFKWHVDHVIPIAGKLVCGLHIHNNLAVIPAAENLRKNRKFDPSGVHYK